MKKWIIKQTRKIFSSHIVDLEGRLSENPRNGVEHEFYVARFPDWCNVIAVTGTNNLVFIRHYRHGSGKFETEFPGGCLDPKEDILQAAKRELLEETGYAGESAVLIGNYSPNPAFQTNRCYTVLVKNAQKISAQNLDDGEDIEIITKGIDEVEQMIKNGEIDNAMMIAAYYFYKHSSTVK